MKEFREGIPKQVLNQQMGKICVSYGRLNNLESGFLKVAVRLCVCVCICVDGVLKNNEKKNSKSSTYTQRITEAQLG